MRSTKNALWFLGSLGVGLLSIVIGFMNLLEFPTEARASAGLTQLPIVNSRTLNSLPAGSRVFVEGRISARNTVADFDFVAYQREEYRGRRYGGSSFRNREIWRKDEQLTPKLQLSVGGTYLWVSNTNYTLDTAPSFYQTSKTLSWDGATNEGTKRYTGFRHNDTVAVVGILQGSGRSRVIVAEVLHGGSATSYIAAQQQSAQTMPFAGIGFIGFGLLLAGMALWPLLRI
ncbi:hypothetical protein HC891_06140 [Candidatus Gracilibacteria bacterium]|nr:hypothetical protein [Candidatus Gracilibacteria bacterium]